MSKDLNPQKALIFRIVHRDNMRDVWAHGLHCKNGSHGKKYTQIGNPELIAKRDGRVVPCAPGGTLSDYVPFYFTPYTPMLYNIKTGYGGIQKRPVEEIIILISSLYTLKSQKVPFVFSDRHNLADLNWIIWPTLQARDFRKDDLDRFEKYQAEALIHKHMPLSALTGVVCYNDSARAEMQVAADAHKVSVKILAQPNWYL